MIRLMFVTWDKPSFSASSVPSAARWSSPVCLANARIDCRSPGGSVAKLSGSTTNGSRRNELGRRLVLALLEADGIAAGQSERPVAALGRTVVVVIASSRRCPR